MGRCAKTTHEFILINPMRVLQIGADRSKRGILYPSSTAWKRQEAYAAVFGSLDIIGFSLREDAAVQNNTGSLTVYPTNSSSKLLWGIDAIRIARRLQRPDVVSAQDPFETGLVAWFIARKFGVPLHIQVHTDFLSLEYARLSLLNRLRVWIAGFVLRQASRIRAVSERVKNSIENEYNLSTNISVLPIFVDIQKFRNAESLTDFSDVRIASSAYKILVVSREAPEKNIRLAIEAFKKAAPSDACLILIGDTDVRSANQRDRIYGMGRVDPERYYKSVDLVLVPSKYEGYGLVIIEALAAGAPVLSTDVGIAREAGAIITTQEEFSSALAKWFKEGPREGHLKNYPYKNFDEYVRAYCGDISSCIRGQ